MKKTIKSIFVFLFVFLLFIFIANAETATECVITQGDTWVSTAVPDCAFCSGLQDALAGCDYGFSNYHFFSFNSSAFTFSPSANITRWYIKGLTDRDSTWYGNVKLYYYNHDCPATVSNYNYYNLPSYDMYSRCSATTLGFNDRSDCYWTTTTNPKSSSCWSYLVLPDYDMYCYTDDTLSSYTDYYQRDYSMYSAPQLCVEYTTAGVVAPSIEIVSPQDYQNLPQNAPTYVTLKWTSSDSDSANVRDKVYYDGLLVYDTTHIPGTYQTSVYVTSNDYHYWKVTSDDGTTVTDSDIYWFSVGQNFSPEPVLYAPTNGTTYSNTQLSVYLNYTCTDSDSSSVTARLFVDGSLVYNSTFAQGTLQTKQYWVSPDRTYRWYIRCTDGITDIKSDTNYFIIGAGASTNLSMILNSPEDQTVFAPETPSTFLNFTTTAQLHESSSTDWHEKLLYNQTASLGANWDTKSYDNHLYGCAYNSTVGDLVFYYCNNMSDLNEICSVRTVEITGDIGDLCSIDINPSNGRPGIVYQEWNGVDCELRYAKASSTNGTGSWTILDVSSTIGVIDCSIPPKLKYTNAGLAYTSYGQTPISTIYLDVASITTGGTVTEIPTHVSDIAQFSEADLEIVPTNSRPVLCLIDGSAGDLESAVYDGVSAWSNSVIDTNYEYDYCNLEYFNDTYAGIGARIVSTNKDNTSMMTYSDLSSVLYYLDLGASNLEFTKPYLSFSKGAVNKSIAVIGEDTLSGDDYIWYCKGGEPSYPDLATNCFQNFDNWELVSGITLPTNSRYKVQVHRDNLFNDYLTRWSIDGSYRMISQVWYGTISTSYYNNIIQELWVSLNSGTYLKVFDQTAQPGNYAYNYSLLPYKSYSWFGITTDTPEIVNTYTQYFYTNGIGNISNTTFAPIVSLVAPSNTQTFSAETNTYNFEADITSPTAMNVTNKIYIDGTLACSGNLEIPSSSQPLRWICNVGDMGGSGTHNWYATSQIVSDPTKIGTSQIWNYTIEEGESGTNQPPIINLVSIDPGSYLLINMSYLLGIEAFDPENNPMQFKIICGYGSSSELDLGWESTLTRTCPGHPTLGTYTTMIYATDDIHGTNYYETSYPLTVYVVNQSTYDSYYSHDYLVLPDELVNITEGGEENGLLPAIYFGLIAFFSVSWYWILGIALLISLFLTVWIIYTKVMNT